MAAPFTTVWRHYTGTASADGLVTVQSGNGPGTHAVAGGGFATGADSSNTDTVWTGNDGTPVPLVGSYSQYDSANDATYIVSVFAAPSGTKVRTHTWVHLA